jgi:hypothetical protein
MARLYSAGEAKLIEGMIAGLFSKHKDELLDNMLSRTTQMAYIRRSSIVGHVGTSSTWFPRRQSLRR